MAETERGRSPSVAAGEPIIRPARAAEAESLGDLAVRSAGYWGTDPAFVESARRGLTPSHDDIAAGRVCVLDQDDRVLGFYGLQPHAAEIELCLLFVEPAAIGRGNGKRLWRHAVATARALGYRRLMIKSDPNAEWFYLAQGARRVGEERVSQEPDFVLKIMHLDLAGARV